LSSTMIGGDGLRHVGAPESIFEPQMQSVVNSAAPGNLPVS
jgi:hypothetical protein